MSRRDLIGRGSRESTVRELVFAIADTDVELDLNHDLGGNGEGKGLSGARQDNRASRMLPALTLSYLTPDMGGNPVLNIGDKRHQGGQSRDPSRAFLRLVVFMWLTIS